MTGQLAKQMQRRMSCSREYIWAALGSRTKNNIPAAVANLATTRSRSVYIQIVPSPRWMCVCAKQVMFYLGRPSRGNSRALASHLRRSFN